MTDSSPFRELSILVADPSAYLASLTGSMLRTLGVSMIREATDGLAAASELNLRKVDIFIVDSHLRGIDGVELTRRLRAGEFGRRNRTVAVIMTSTNPDELEIKRARDAGITEFLRRPYSPSDISLRIEAILRAPRPFIEAEAYAGPDRRRRDKTLPVAERRSRGTARGFKPVVVRND